jgi:predicted phage tail component-like protein
LAIKLNGTTIPPFVRVHQVRRPIHPPIIRATVKVPGRNGIILSATSFDESRIYLEFGISFISKEELESKISQLVAWLYHEEPVPLVLSGSEKYYQVQVEGETHWETLRRIGKGTITFLCIDPFRYGKEHIIPLHSSTDPILITNPGVETYPQINLTFHQSTPEFTILSGKNFLYFGQSAPVDTVTPTPKRTRILYDDGTSATGWTTGVGVDGGTIQGSLESPGSHLRQAGADFGTGTTWHGAAGIKMLNKELQDFTLEAHIAFKSADVRQIARLEIYLLDLYHHRIGKIAMVDTTAQANSPVLEARAGSLSTGFYFTNTDVKKGFYTNFYGKWTLQRVGTSWTFEVAKKDTKGKYIDSRSWKYQDRNHQYHTPIAGIQLHFGAYATYPPYPTFYLDDLTIWEENVIDPATQVPNIFEAGDQLRVDNETGETLKNGSPFFEALNPAGSYIYLQKGINQISISPAIATGEIRFRERWLS